MFAKFVVLTCIALLFASGCARQEPSFSSKQDWIDDFIDSLVTDLEETGKGLFQEEDSLHYSDARHKLSTRIKSVIEENQRAWANDDRTSIQRQLDSLREHAPDLFDVLRASGFDDMSPVEKYRTLVPLLREHRWGIEDSSHVVDTLNRIEQLLDTTSDGLLISYTDRVVSVGVNNLLSQYVLELERTAWLEESVQRVESVADIFPDTATTFLTCTSGAATERAGCFSRCESTYFEDEVVGIIDVLENPDKHVEAIRKWRSPYFRKESKKFDDLLMTCRTSHWDAIGLCYDTLAIAAEEFKPQVADQ